MADAAPLALTTKLLRRSHAPAEFDLYKAALEWSLVDPIIINSRADLKSQSRWKSQGLEPYHHQVTNLINFCRRLPVTLLADDVGLGKTISAGLVASELISRKRISRLFIVCPKLLGPQWKEELETKFDIPAEVVIGNKLVDAEPPDDIGAIITTYHSARLYIGRIPSDPMAAVDEPVRMTRCLSEGDGCVASRRCNTHFLWDALGAHIEQFLATATLADVLRGRYSMPAARFSLSELAAAAKVGS